MSVFESKGVKSYLSGFENCEGFFSFSSGKHEQQFWTFPI
jgi:hypothetical protein